MTRAPFKFLTEPLLGFWWRLDDPVNMSEAALVQEMHDDWGSVPCADPGFPPRERGRYHVRFGREHPGDPPSSNRYYIYTYFMGRWWVAVNWSWGTGLEPEISLSNRERAALEELARIGRWNWLDRRAQRLLRRARHQDELREIVNSSRIWRLKMRKEEECQSS